ncbi:MAG: hypothetical protein K2M91_05525, partial [Lachnospiraceae bacterium]|nr:hypothetical protein [Lachnospiraceae bacterium]
MQKIHEFLQYQDIIPYTKLPGGLVVELAIVYVLWVGDKDYLAPTETCEAIADIWNHQENRRNNYKELQSKASFIRRKSYDEYRTMRKVVLEKAWEYRRHSDDMEEYKYTLSMASPHFIADDNKVNSMDIDDIRLEDNITHVCEVELYDYLLRKYDFPIEACSYMYKYFELEDIETTQYAEIYKNLKAHILEQYPDMNEFYKSSISAKDYSDDLSDLLKALQSKYKNLGWGKNFVDLFTPCYATDVISWCEEEAQEVYAIVRSALFQKYQYESNVVSQLIISEFTITQAKIFYEIYNKPELFPENSRIMRLVHSLFHRISGYGRQEQYLLTQEYDYDMEIGSYDFWEYFLTVAAGDKSMQMNRDDSPIPGGFLYMDKMMLPAYINCVYAPSVEWRVRFTGYNKEKGSFENIRKLTLEIKDGMTVTIEFHFHYVRYYVNEKETFGAAFDVDNLFSYAADNQVTFLLLLPITRIKYEEKQRVYDRLTEFLSEFVRFPASVSFLAAMLSNDSAYAHQIGEVTSRHYIENLTDCYRLDRYQNRRQRLFHFHSKFGCWEYIGIEMCGKHFRDRLDRMLGEMDEEGWDMEHFKESDLSLPY